MNEIAARTAEMQPALYERDGCFGAGYNRASFFFRHGLAGNPLFELDSLVNLSRRLPAHSDFAYWSNGKVDVDDHWEKSGPQYSLQDTLLNIAGNNSLVMLKHVGQDAVFGPLLQRLLATVVELCGSRMRDDVIVGRATLLIASPHRITAYHIDADTNFLLQLAGDKDLSVFDQSDHSLITDEELERYHAGDANGAQFKEARQQDAHHYELGAGCGAHIPCTAPHWAQNRDKVSVALSLNYDLRSVARETRIYRLNHRLRRLGLHPTPPGVSRWRDSLKLASETSIEAVRDLVKERPKPVNDPAWKPVQQIKAPLTPVT